MSVKVRMVPRNVQLRLDEPGDGELLALLRAARDARTDDGAFNARCDLTDLYRSLDPGPGGDKTTYLRVLDRVRALRQVVADEERPP